MSWGPSRRPKISNKLGGPIREEGSDGDIQLRQTQYGEKLFGKLGGRWVSTYLSLSEDVFSIRNNKGQKTISLNSDGSAQFGSFVDVGSFLRITGHRGLIDFQAGGDDSSSNICIGNLNYRPMNALDDDEDNDDNIAIGDYTLYMAGDATDNVVIGNGCMRYMGRHASTTEVTCGSNVAIGVDCLQGHADDTYPRAWENVAIGFNAMKLSARSEIVSPSLSETNVENCKHNVCIGSEAGYNFSGTQSVFIGRKAGYGGNTGSGILSSTIGPNNVAIGYKSMDGLTFGQDNIAIGSGSGDSVTTLNYTISIGRDSDVTGDFGIALGYGVSVITDKFAWGRDHAGSGTDMFTSQDFDTTTVAWTHSSDARMKKNIQDDTLGLEFINKIKGRTFQWRPTEEYPEEWHAWEEDEKGNKIYSSRNTEKVMHGYIAQEVKEALDACSVDINAFPLWSEDDKGKQQLATEFLRYPMLKAIQELSAKIDTMQTEINNLKAGE